MGRTSARTVLRRAHRKTNRPDEPSDNVLERSRGGFGSKLHLVTDGRGVALGVLVTAGQAHESRSFEALTDSVRIRRRRRPEAVAGDRAYSYPRIRAWLRRCGIEAVIPTRSSQPRERLNRRKYRGRNAVERCIGWLKGSRRVATRYEKLASHCLAMVKLAVLQRCLKLLNSSNRTWAHRQLMHARVRFRKSIAPLQASSQFCIQSKGIMSPTGEPRVPQPPSKNRS